ncbi:hypothetical protein [Cryptosporangium minutisporangium]|uniref:Uncharacterized protein n=1 Tax=Cryptosporangium minutisporangium TaxID=113569 RepID=A0ABP6SRR3_9ACTN
MEIKPGVKLSSAASSAEFIVVRAAPGDVDLACAGEPLVTVGTAPAGPKTGTGEAILVGKRYSDEAGSLELLCTKPGRGPVTLAGTPLRLAAAKALPASD